MGPGDTKPRPDASVNRTPARCVPALGNPCGSMRAWRLTKALGTCEGGRRPYPK